MRGMKAGHPGSERRAKPDQQRRAKPDDQIALAISIAASLANNEPQITVSPDSITLCCQLESMRTTGEVTFTMGYGEATRQQRIDAMSNDEALQYYKSAVAADFRRRARCMLMELMLQGLLREEPEELVKLMSYLTDKERTWIIRNKREAFKDNRLNVNFFDALRRGYDESQRLGIPRDSDRYFRLLAQRAGILRVVERKRISRGVKE
jgi:hypothetical protein